MTAEVEIEDNSLVTVIIKRKLSNLNQIEVEPVGKCYHDCLSARSNYNKYGDSFHNEEDSESENEENDITVEIEDDISYLRSLDPADWKNQDHYSVLGLKKYRYKASEEDIKRAYRVMVLRHHPDKRKGGGEEIRPDDDYFTCITKAYEILGDVSKRRAYDSVDSEFDDDIPSSSNYNKENFFKVFSPVFERNARWSLVKHVPLLGKPEDSREKVDKFYSFWYEFESWREFSYLDEEEKEKGQDREERRWIEKQNKAERARRKKEEMARIRKLVDTAYTFDPRVEKFKEEERERKLAIKKARQDAIRKKIEAEEKARRESEEVARRIKEAAEAELKAKQEAERKEKDAIKKLLKKERKSLRTICKDSSYYTDDEVERVTLMTDVELLCEALTSVQLNELNQKLSQNSKDKIEAKQCLLEEVSRVKNQLEKEKAEIQAAASRGNNVNNEEKSQGKTWHSEDIQLLIKAVNLFPAGTSKRWEIIAEYLNQHSLKNCHRTAKDVLNKAKELQKSDYQMREAANKNALMNMEKQNSGNVMISDSKASQRLDSPQELLGMNLSAWSAEEQRLLEQALKTYPVSVEDRWGRIADCIPNRSKKDCMKRYKELAEMVKAKKAAQIAASKK